MSGTHTPLTSTGRGGAGNIGHDTNVYTDGAIVHEGYQGESTRTEYSSGRGGAGNIVDSPSVRPVNDRSDVDYIPENSLREQPSNFHTGRGGGGNVHKKEFDGHSGPQHAHHHEASGKPSLTDKIKDKVEGLMGKKHEEKPAGGV